MKYIVMGPEGFPTRPDVLDTREETEAELASFLRRFEHQGYYSAVGYRIPLQELPMHCSIEESEEELSYILALHECACSECGYHIYPGEGGYCIKDTDGSLLWFCDESCVPSELQASIDDALVNSLATETTWIRN